MSLARNLSKFKPSSSGLIETADIADDAVTTAKVNPAQTDITSVGTLTGLTTSGDVAVDTDTLFVDVSQDNVGINTNAVDSDVALEVNGNVAFKNGANYSLYADVDGALTAYHNGTAKLATASDGVTIAGDIVLSGSGNGINLGVTSNTDSNTLDDYEEGTFTPTLHYQNTSGLTLSYDAQSGTYTKIGRMVHVYISLQADISGSLVNDNIAFRGLPFNISVNGGSTGSVVNISSASGSGVDKTFTLQPSASDYLYISNAQGNGNYADDVGTGSNVLFQVATWYIAS